MSQDRISLKINGRVLQVQSGKTILQVARENGIFIPSLCELEGLPAFAGCRLCLVEVAGKPNWLPACQVRAEEGMEIITSTPELEELRRNILQLILSEHPYFCLLCQEKNTCQEEKATISRALEPGGCVFCQKDGNCELQKVVEYLKIEKVEYSFRDRALVLWLDDPFIKHNPNLCILCGRCVRVCHEIRGEGVLTFAWRGQKMEISTAFGRRLLESDCSFCGACLDVCPVAAFSEKGTWSERNRSLRKFNYLCSLCSSVCEMEVEATEEGEILRIHPAEENRPAFLSGCSRGRFGLKELLNDTQGSLKNLAEVDPARRRKEPDLASEEVARKLKQYQPEEMAFIFDGQSPLEEIINFLEIARTLQTKNVFWFYPDDFLTRLAAFEREQAISFRRKLEKEFISRARTFLLVDCDLKNEGLKLWLQVKDRLRQSASLITVDSGLNSLELQASYQLRCRPGTEALALVLLQQKIIEKKPDLDFVEGQALWREKIKKFPLSSWLVRTGLSNAQLEGAAECLLKNGPVVVFFGPGLLRKEGWKATLAYLWNLATCLGAELFPVTIRVNELFLEKLTTRYSAKISPDLLDISSKIRGGEIRAAVIQGEVPLLVKPEFLLVLSPWSSTRLSENHILWPQNNIIFAGGHFGDVFGNLKKRTSGNEVSSGSQKLKEILFSGEVSAFREDELIEELARELISEKMERPKYVLNVSLDEEPGKLFTPVTEDGFRDLIIFIEPNLDCYAGRFMGKEGGSFRLLRHPDLLWLNGEDILRWGLREGQNVILEVEGLEFSLILKADRRMKKQTAVVRPDLHHPFWIKKYKDGLVKGKIRVLKN
ncbi:MAG: (2Fe-2S)-binding protein [Candidatus Aminicenantes bacterium]|nr:(2Fe-2S)-binding protein [Candidatus Aminicenantes bacterium]